MRCPTATLPVSAPPLPCALCAQIARVLSCFYIILQLILLLDFFYRVNEWLLERRSCNAVTVTLTAICIVGSFVGIGFLYKVRGSNAWLQI